MSKTGIILSSIITFLTFSLVSVSFYCHKLQDDNSELFSMCKESSVIINRQKDIINMLTVEAGKKNDCDYFINNDGVMVKFRPSIFIIGRTDVRYYRLFYTEAKK